MFRAECPTGGPGTFEAVGPTGAATHAIATFKPCCPTAVRGVAGQTFIAKCPTAAPGTFQAACPTGAQGT